MNYFSN